MEEGLARSLPALPTVALISMAWLGFIALLDDDWAALEVHVQGSPTSSGTRTGRATGPAIGFALAAVFQARAGRAETSLGTGSMPDDCWRSSVTSRRSSPSLCG